MKQVGMWSSWIDVLFLLALNSLSYIAQQDAERARFVVENVGFVCDEGDI